MELTKCKVIRGKYGPQVMYEGDYWKVGSYSVPRVEVGKEYDFILEETEHEGRTNRWANLPREDNAEDKSKPAAPVKKKKEAEKKMPAAAEPKPGRKTQAIPFPMQAFMIEKIFERIADALEGIEELLAQKVDNDGEEGD